MWSAGRGAPLDRGGVAQAAVGGVAPYPGEVPALGGGGGGGTGATELVGTDAAGGGGDGIPATGVVGDPDE